MLFRSQYRPTYKNFICFCELDLWIQARSPAEWLSVITTLYFWCAQHYGAIRNSEDFLTHDFQSSSDSDACRLSDPYFTKCTPLRTFSIHKALESSRCSNMMIWSLDPYLCITMSREVSRSKFAGSNRTHFGAYLEKTLEPDSIHNIHVTTCAGRN